MSDFSQNMEFNPLNSIISNKTNELAQSGTQKSDTKLSDVERRKFEKVSRGFESMFVNMMLKEMKSAMLDEESKEFNGPLSEYTDLLFSEQVASQGTGIGIAEKVYKFLTGEELSSSIIVQQAEPAYKHIDRSKMIVNPSSKIEDVKKTADTIKISGNFIDKVKSRIENYNDIIESASAKFNVPQELIKAVITAESAGHQHAKSKVGAKGLMQLMDGTARDMGVTDSFDAAQNIFGGTKYLRNMLDRFGSTELALAAYNAGPGNVEKYNGIPPFNETQSYIRKVNKYINVFRDENVL